MKAKQRSPGIVLLSAHAGTYIRLADADPEEVLLQPFVDPPIDLLGLWEAFGAVPSRAEQPPSGDHSVWKN